VRSPLRAAQARVERLEGEQRAAEETVDWNELVARLNSARKKRSPRREMTPEEFDAWAQRLRAAAGGADDAKVVERLIAGQQRWDVLPRQRSVPSRWRDGEGEHGDGGTCLSAPSRCQKLKASPRQVARGKRAFGSLSVQCPCSRVVDFSVGNYGAENRVMTHAAWRERDKAASSEDREQAPHVSGWRNRPYRHIFPSTFLEPPA